MEKKIYNKMQYPNWQYIFYPQRTLLNNAAILNPPSVKTCSLLPLTKDTKAAQNWLALDIAVMKIRVVVLKAAASSASVFDFEDAVTMKSVHRPNEASLSPLSSYFELGDIKCRGTKS